MLSKRNDIHQQASALRIACGHHTGNEAFDGSASAVSAKALRLPSHPEREEREPSPTQAGELSVPSRALVMGIAAGDDSSIANTIRASRSTLPQDVVACLKAKVQSFSAASSPGFTISVTPVGIPIARSPSGTMNAGTQVVPQ